MNIYKKLIITTISLLVISSAYGAPTDREKKRYDGTLLRKPPVYAKFSLGTPKEIRNSGEIKLVNGGPRDDIRIKQLSLERTEFIGLAPESAGAEKYAQITVDIPGSSRGPITFDINSEKGENEVVSSPKEFKYNGIIYEVTAKSKFREVPGLGYLTTGIQISAFSVNVTFKNVGTYDKAEDQQAQADRNAEQKQRQQEEFEKQQREAAQKTGEALKFVRNNPPMYIDNESIVVDGITFSLGVVKTNFVSRETPVMPDTISYQKGEYRFATHVNSLGQLDPDGLVFLVNGNVQNDVAVPFSAQGKMSEKLTVTVNGKVYEFDLKYILMDHKYAQYGVAKTYFAELSVFDSEAHAKANEDANTGEANQISDQQFILDNPAVYVNTNEQELNNIAFQIGLVDNTIGKVSLLPSQLMNFHFGGYADAVGSLLSGRLAIMVDNLDQGISIPLQKSGTRALDLKINGVFYKVTLEFSYTQENTISGQPNVYTVEIKNIETMTVQQRVIQDILRY